MDGNKQEYTARDMTLLSSNSAAFVSCQEQNISQYLTDHNQYASFTVHQHAQNPAHNNPGQSEIMPTINHVNRCPGQSEIMPNISHVNRCPGQSEIMPDTNHVNHCPGQSEIMPNINHVNHCPGQSEIMPNINHVNRCPGQSEIMPTINHVNRCPGQSGIMPNINPVNRCDIGPKAQLQACDGIKSEQLHELHGGRHCDISKLRHCQVKDAAIAYPCESIKRGAECKTEDNVDKSQVDHNQACVESEDHHLDERNRCSSVSRRIDITRRSKSQAFMKQNEIMKVKLNIPAARRSKSNALKIVGCDRNSKNKVYNEIGSDCNQMEIKETVDSHNVSHLHIQDRQSHNTAQVDFITVTDTNGLQQDDHADAGNNSKAIAVCERAETVHTKSSNELEDEQNYKSQKVFECKTCHKVTRSVRAYERHKNLHTGRYACTTCNKHCNSAESLKQHAKVHQGFVGDHICNVCDKSFYDKSSLHKHTLSVHMGITHHACPYCERSFYAKKTLKEHVRVHTGERPFKCNICPKTYKRISDLNHHVRLHKGETSHTCEYCGGGFRRMSELKRHMQKHQNKVVEKPLKTYQCEWCSMVSTDVNDFNDHVAKHIEQFNNETDNLIHKQNLVDQIVSDLDNRKLAERQMAFEKNQKFIDGLKGIRMLNPQHENVGATPHAFNDENISNFEASGNTKRNDMFHHKTDNENDASASNVSPNFNGVSGIIIQSVSHTSETPLVSKQTDESEKIKCNIVEAKRQCSEVENVTDMNNVLVKKEVAETDVSSDFEENVEDDFQSVEEYGNKVKSVNDTMKVNTKRKKKKKVKIVFKKSIASKRIIQRKRNVVKKNKKWISEYNDNKLSEKISETNVDINKRKINAKQNTENSGFVCEECGKVFPKKQSFCKHMNLHSGIYKCEKCSKTFSCQTSLKEHLDNHMGKNEKEAKCNVCEKVYYDQSSLNKHVKTVHMNMKPLSCSQCGLRFSERKTLVEHMRVHTGERPFRCELCDQTFKRQSELNFHVKKHTGETKLTCKLCGLGFRRKSELQKHVIIKHTGQKPYKCNICDRSYMSNSVLKEHLITHTTTKNFECERCGKAFHTQAKLDKHLRIKTDCTKKAARKNGMLECKFCFLEFAERPDLDSHVDKMHVKMNGVIMYGCKVCWKEFRRQQALKRHLKIHAGVRDYKCEKCGASFIQKHHLSQHERTHTGEKPYECFVCHKTFAQNATLYSHLKLHKMSC